MEINERYSGSIYAAIVCYNGLHRVETAESVSELDEKIFGRAVVYRADKVNQNAVDMFNDNLTSFDANEKVDLEKMLN